MVWYEQLIVRFEINNINIIIQNKGNLLGFWRIDYSKNLKNDPLQCLKSINLNVYG